MQRRRFLHTALGALTAGFTPLPTRAEGARARAPNGFIRTNWSADPYALGSYSFIAKGASRRDHRALARPLRNRLFFAGEATHPDYNSTVHAAYESGLIAAEAVAETDARTVGIIGAGMSGLAAADALLKVGYDVTVLEARDRIGGRIWTQDSLGTPLDLGASWIHGVNGNPLMTLAEDMQVATQPTSDNYIVRGGDGRRMTDRETPSWIDDVVSVQHSAGAASDQMNMRAYWRDNDYGGDDVVFPGGYAQLFDAFSPDIDIKLGRAITAVDIVEDGVRLADRNGESQMFDVAIVTVPLGVLKQGTISFNPPLPVRKQTAIDVLGMGVLDKVYLRYDEVFWDRDATWIITPETDLPQGQFNQWLNLYPYIGEPIIMAFNGAQPARDLASLSDLEIVKRATQTLEAAYPMR